MASNGLDEDELLLPPRPALPLPTDCCGTGCTPCVNDLYEEELSQWLKLKAMTVSERRKFYSERDGSAVSERVGALSQESFKIFHIVSIKSISPDSFLYSFALPDDHVLGIGVGQHVVLRFTDESGCFITRQYTPVSPLNQTGHFEIAIKIYNEGKASQKMKTWKVGTIVEFKGPFGGFTYSQNQFKQIVMIACGTGIAPMIQLIRQILNDKDDYTKIRLLYSSRTQDDILLKDFLDTFTDYWNFSVKYFLSRSSAASLDEDKGSIKYGDQVIFGRIDQGVLVEEMVTETICIADCFIVVCGTNSFNKDMINYVLHLGFKRSQIFIF